MSTTTRTPYATMMLCHETRDEVAERINHVLGGRRFTLVMANSYNPDTDKIQPHAIEVYPSERLVRPAEASDTAHVSWATTTFAQGVVSSAVTRHQAARLTMRGRVFLDFEPRKVTIDHYAPAGYRLRWIYAVERHED